jgi:hypothetical protein
MILHPKFELGQEVYVAHPGSGPGWSKTLIVEKPLTINGIGVGNGNTIVYGFTDSAEEVDEFNVFPSQKELLEYVTRWLLATDKNK